MKLQYSMAHEPLLDVSTREDLVANMKKAGIQKVWIAGFFSGKMVNIEELKQAKAFAELHGLEVGSVTIPIGHPGNSLNPDDPDLDLEIPKHWHYRIDNKGETVYFCGAIDTCLIEDNGKAAKLLYDAGFKEVFLDDDLRVGNFNEFIEGCYCDACLAEFNQIYQRQETRESLMVQITKKLDTELMKDWVAFQCDKITAVMAATAIEGVQPGIMVMHFGDERHGIDIPAMRKQFPNALFRVGEYQFNDPRFTKPYGKAEEMLGIMYHLSFMDKKLTYSESTIFPPRSLKEHNLVYKAKMAITAGLENILFMSGTWVLDESYWQAIAAALPVLQEFDKAIAGGERYYPVHLAYGTHGFYAEPFIPTSLPVLAGLPVKPVRADQSSEGGELLLFFGEYTLSAEWQKKLPSYKEAAEKVPILLTGYLTSRFPRKGILFSCIIKVLNLGGSRMISNQQTLILSPYIAIYDIVVPKDNMLRQINELVDFSFVHEELQDKYCLDNGRNAVPPIRMFKYLLLKSIFDLSDADIVERSKYDMSLKYFLDMAPEDGVIDPSSLTKFRKLRLKDVNLLDMLIQKTVAIALKKEIIKSHAIIVDATHTKARFNQQSPKEILMEKSKLLRKAVYQIDEKMKDKFPPKTTTNELEDELEYCQKVIDAVEKEEAIREYPKVKEKLNYLKEIVTDHVEHLQLSNDPDARVGHKTADSSFFGYKTHIAMNEERIITAAVITTGEKSDGKQLQTLIHKSRETGMDIDTVIGDTAYSEKENIQYADANKLQLVSKLNPMITQGARKKEDEFEFNKDAGMYVCKAGHMATRRAVQGKKNRGKNQADTYYFDIEKCKQCPFKEGCYKEGAKSKTYSVSIKSTEHSEQKAFQESEYFKEKAKERYKIEAKNSELKHRHGYDVASTSGLVGMQMQGAMAIFTVNIKRILTLMK